MKFKNAIITILKSALIGVACIVPGVSGGTLAVILGLYDKILEAVSNIKKDFKNSIKFLWPVVLGIALGLLATIYPIKLAFQHFPLPTITLFAGLIIGSLPSLCKNIARKPNISGSISMLVSIVVVVGICFLGNGTAIDLSPSMNIGLYFAVFFIGILGSCALVIPGISGSALLLILGFWEPILNCITEILSLTNIGHNILVIFIFGVGVLIGFFLISKLMTFLLKRFHYQTFMAIIGFIAGSIFALFWQIKDNFIPEGNQIAVIVVSVVLFVLGLVGAYFLSKVQKSDDANKEEKKIENVQD